MVVAIVVVALVVVGGCVAGGCVVGPGACVTGCYKTRSCSFVLFISVRYLLSQPTSQLYLTTRNAFKRHGCPCYGITDKRTYRSNV